MRQGNKIWVRSKNNMEIQLAKKFLTAHDIQYSVTETPEK